MSPGPSILLVTESLDASRGGQERSVREYLEALQRRGIDVLVMTRSSPGHSPLAGNILVSTRGRTRAARLASFLTEAEELVRHHRSTRVVQSMVPLRGAHLYLPRGGLHPEAYARSLAARGRVSRLLARLLPLPARRRLLLLREAELLGAPAGPVLVALSDYVARQAREHYQLPSPRVRVVRNGVELSALTAAGEHGMALRRELGLSKDVVVFAAAAHNYRLKGIPQVLDAVRLLPGGPKWVVLVAGGRRTGTTLGGRVRFLGGLPGLAGFLHCADVLVHPSFYDPSSRVVLEALALGRPVVTTVWNGAADFVGDAGFVLDDPRDVPGLSRAMVSLLDPAVRKRAAQAARSRASAVSMERHTEEMLSLIREVAP